MKEINEKKEANQVQLANLIYSLSLNVNDLDRYSNTDFLVHDTQATINLLTRKLKRAQGKVVEERIKAQFVKQTHG
jgi:aminoglycoside phosphotransferase family enzyme